MTAATGGDERAWGVIVARFERTIRATARRHRLSRADQDEVVQRVWVRLVRNIGAIRDPAALAGWLATAARNESLRLLSSCREVPVDSMSFDETADTGLPEDDAVAAERCAALHRAVDRLPDRQRALMRMLAAEPAMSYDQIGAVLRMPKGSIGPTRQRSFARLAADPHLARAVGRAHPASCRHRAPGTSNDATGDDTA